jgi:PAS domain S-box-containing protein
LKDPSTRDLLKEIERLGDRLRESEETLQAIRRGDVDAIIVADGAGEQVYTLQTAERIYRTIIEEMNEGAATLSEDGTLLFCNSAFARLVGVHPDWLVGTSIREVVPPEERELFEAMIRKSLREGVRGETTLLASGQAVPVFLSIKAIEGTSPPILSLLATDLREQKRNESILAEGQLSAAILENVGEAVIVFDAQGRVTHASRIATDLCGEFPRHKHFESLCDLRLQERAAGESPSLRFSDLWTGHLRHAEAKCRRTDGQELDFLLSSAPLFDKEKNRIGLVLTMVDITPRKSIEQDLLRVKGQLEGANQELENRVVRPNWSRPTGPRTSSWPT